MSEADQLTFVHGHHLELMGVASVTMSQQKRLDHLESIKKLDVCVKGPIAPEELEIMTEDDELGARK